MQENSVTQGSQAIRRTMHILRVIARFPYPGPTLDEVASSVALKRSTAHRLLRYLVAEGLLAYDRGERTYTSGCTLADFALLNPLKYHAHIQDEVLNRVAFATGQTAYLIARVGSEAVCMRRADGYRHIRVTGVEVGQRRPLGVGAGGIALLAALDFRQVEKFVGSMGPALRTYGDITPEVVLADAMEAKARGFAVSPGRLYPEAVGVGVTLSNDPQSWLAVSITAPANFLAKFSPERLAELIRGELDN